MILFSFAIMLAVGLGLWLAPMVIKGGGVGQKALSVKAASKGDYDDAQPKARPKGGNDINAASKKLKEAVVKAKDSVEKAVQEKVEAVAESLNEIARKESQESVVNSSQQDSSSQSQKDADGYSNPVEKSAPVLSDENGVATSGDEEVAAKTDELLTAEQVIKILNALKD